ncbi:MaoC/PaaZ C-terminal domain-containing protein [Janibacter sp. GXQ6167]|uniref:MaoC/PaaZ C-terminal domain-containing protein n=1 Tax=Janibacter sp. GXQ6167 TaxID=3240791 RepID=UPI0035238C7C
MSIETFTSPPALAPILARAAVMRGSSATELPQTRLVLVGYEVDRADLREYQRLTGFPVEDRLPHTYPHLLGFGLQAHLMARPSFPFALVGLVHVENVITAYRPLTADEKLDITVSADNLRDHPKGRQVDLLTQVHVQGELVWEGRSTYLSRGRSNPDADRGSQPPAIPTGYPAAKWRLEGDLGRRYAAVSGDINPIHLYGITARAMGFPSAIAHGMWTYARTLAALGPWVNGATTSHVWFKKPVLLPASVDLVVDKSGDQVVAGLRNSRKPATEHLVLTVGRD